MDQGIQVGHEQQSQQQNNIAKLNEKPNMRTVQPPRRDHDRYLFRKKFFMVNYGYLYDFNILCLIIFIFFICLYIIIL